MNYKFSVIIPVYNAEKTINRCLDSLLRQKQDNAEIILINDGSKDRSGEICREYASKHTCIVYIEQENAGAASARNAGLAVASGEYITFVDSDDYVVDGYFAGLDSSNEDFVVFSYQTVRPKEVSEFCFGQRLLNATDNTDIILHVLRNRIAAPWNKRFKREIIERNEMRFKPDLVIGEDFVFGLEYMLLCESSRVDTTVRYCVDETGSESVTRGGKYNFSQFLRIYGHAFKIAEECKWAEPSKSMLMRQVDYLYCRTAFAATEHCIAAREKCAMKISDLVLDFSNQLRADIIPLNLGHLGMSLCIKNKIIPVFFIIAGMHKLMRCVLKRN